MDSFRRAGHALVDGVTDHLAALPSRPVWQPVPAELRERLLSLPLPEEGGALDDVVATTLRDVLPHAMGNGHPAFFGWVNPPPSEAGMLASLAGAAMNPSVVAGDHADVHLERSVVRWLEVRRSLEFTMEQLGSLPRGEVCTPMGSLRPNEIAVALQEGWRGEIAHVVMTDDRGAVRRHKVVDPSFHNWTALAVALPAPSCIGHPKFFPGALARATEISSYRPCPTSPMKRSPVTRSKLNRNGLRSP